jgi:chitin disaccharide deacetylase
MTQTRLAGLIAHLPEGVTEIYTHPATSSDFAGAALISPDLRHQIAAAGVASGGFADAVNFRRP